MGGLGIIGGADGPTAIFLSGSPVGLLAVVGVAVAAIGGAVWLLARRRK